MKLKDLKKAWSQVSADDTGRDELTEEKIRAMLGKRTSSLIERVDKNLKYGFIIVFSLIIIMFLMDILIQRSPVGDNYEMMIPKWIYVLDWAINILILCFFLFLFVRYRQVKNHCFISCNLRETLVKIISLLTMYKRLLSWALLFLLIFFITGYISGLYLGAQMYDMSIGLAIASMMIGLLFLVALTGLFYLLMRWIFRKVYGSYLIQLQNTLKELDELE